MLCTARCAHPRCSLGTVKGSARSATRHTLAPDSKAPENLRTPTSVAIEQWKRPNRGGQNLSDRYRRLERSLRGKAALSEFIEDLPGDTTVTSPPDREVHPVHRAPGTVKTFRGLVIPEEPKPPADDECCMSGCAVCVYDLYEESLQAYKASVSALRSSLKASNVPEREWPNSIRESKDSSLGSNVNTARDVTMSAFEELERMLQQKKAEA
ncbi:hypothetical protein OE88DRAFT_1633191 [Heliocybe sulcata]|uniref:Oxidoreductase-like domain-containing protein n=1 Tax=Heliocybe sulcata TaxID=5364 RepID=A0A5C3MWT4_9AGAM|nr:hypothetical protein OE88DRAFT_1633191 [Heliocybe sulcata]